MRLLVYEWHKLFRLKVLWVFLALCLGFNGLLLYEHHYLARFFNEGSALGAELGQRMDEDFTAALEARSRSDYEDAILSAAQAGENVFETYDLENLCYYYQDQFLSSSPWAGAQMAKKYEKLADRQAHLAQTQAALDLYAGPDSQPVHYFLHNTLLRTLTAEGALLGMLGTLFLLSYESLHRTALTVYSSRTGRRRLLGWKVLAGALAGAVLFLLLSAVTLAAYFAVFDYRGVWSASVSSQFNYLTDLLVTRPFLTWADFTVGSYLAAALALGAGLSMVCALLAGILGVLSPNVYYAALLLILLLLGGTYLQSACAGVGFWPGYFLLSFQPVSTWLSAGGWFTELGLNALVPWQEVKATLLCLFLFGGGSALSAALVSRKDVS